MSVDLDNPRSDCEDYHQQLVAALKERDERRAQCNRMEAEYESLIEARTKERDDALSELANFDALARRCADALADEVAVLVRTKVIDARSPAADALLDYRNPPSTERADRMADLERQSAALLRDAGERMAALVKERDVARTELTELQTNEALMKLTAMLRLGEPVRPDIHERVCTQRDAALAERDEARRFLKAEQEWVDRMGAKNLELFKLLGAEYNGPGIVELVAALKKERDAALLSVEDIGALSWARDILSDKVACSKNPFFVGIGEKAVALLERLVTKGARS